MEETLEPLMLIIKPTKEERQAAKYLQGLINGWDWGSEDDYGITRGNYNDQIEAVLSKVSLRYLKRISQKQIIKHYQNYSTYFFAGNNKRVTLAMVDIDCHNKGTHEGALECVNYLIKHYFPNLYFETSRGGKGINGYLIIDKQSLCNQSYNKLMKELEKRLKEVLATQGFDISDIEIKGSCPIVTWYDSAPNYKAGTLARLPRDIVRFHQQGTAKLAAIELIDLVATSIPDYIPQPKLKKISGSNGGQCIDPAEIPKYDLFAETLLQRFNLYEEKISLLSISEEQVESSTPHIKSKRGGCIISKSKIAVLPRDISIALIIGEHFNKHPNPDGSNPTARWKAMWDSLYEAGDVARAWDNKRFAFIRNLLTNCGMIQWVDSNYSLGKACKWTFTEELMATLSELKEETTVTTNTNNIRAVLYGKQLLAIKPESPFFNTKPVQVYEKVFNWGDYEKDVELLFNREAA